VVPSSPRTARRPLVQQQVQPRPDTASEIRALFAWLRARSGRPASGFVEDHGERQ
jgi:hypothetical protein